MRSARAGAMAYLLWGLCSACAAEPSPPPALPVFWIVQAPSAAEAGAAVGPDPAANASGAAVAAEESGPTDGDVALDYERAPGTETDCMTEDELRVAAGLTRVELFAPPDKPARYRVRIALERAAGDRPYRAVVTHQDAAGRQLGRSTADGNRCSDVLTNVIVGLYSAISPRPSPRPARLPTPPRVRQLTDRELLAQVCARFRAVYGPCMDVRAAVLAGGLFSAGFPTDVAGGFYVGGDVFFGEYLKERWSVGVEMRALMPAPALRYIDGGHLEISSVTGAVVPCFHYSVLAGCAMFEAGTQILGGDGRTRGSGFGPLVALGPRLALTLPISGRFAFRAFADLRILAYADRVTIYGPGGVAENVWDPSYVNGLFGVGFSY